MMLHSFGRPARALVAVTLVATTVASCSSSSKSVSLGNDPLGTVVTAMVAAKSGSITGVVNGPKGTKPTELGGTFNGGLTGMGDIQAKFFSATGKTFPTELRWLDNFVYISRGTGTVSSSDPVSLFTRAPSAKPWRKFRLNGEIFSVLPAAFSPTALVQWIQSLKVPMTTHSGESIGSVKTTRLTTGRAIAMGLWVSSTVDVWVGNDARIVRVRVTAPDGTGTQYDVTYGARAPVVAPPSGQISTGNETPVIGPNGPFSTVKSGTSAGVTWALQRATGSQGTVCWKFQATPPLHEQTAANSNAPVCLAPPPTHSDDPSDYVQFLFAGDGAGSYDALVALMPAGVKSLTLGFVGGHTQTVPPDPHFVWIGPSNPLPGYLGVTLADGTQLPCGAGAISGVGDLTNPALTNDLSTSVWGCVPAG